MKTDFATEFVALAVEIAAVSPDAGARLEAELRARYAGRPVRISVEAPVTLERIDGLLRQRMPVREVAIHLGVSRATIYRMIKQPRKSHGSA